MTFEQYANESASSRSFFVHRHPRPFFGNTRVEVIAAFQTLVTMASIMRPSILRQAAMSRSAFAQPAMRNTVLRAAALHTTSKRAAFIPPGPRKQSPRHVTLLEMKC